MKNGYTFICWLETEGRLVVDRDGGGGSGVSYYWGQFSFWSDENIPDLDSGGDFTTF